MRRISGFATVFVAVLAITGACIVHWVLVPRLAQLPGDLSTQRIYTGTATVMANPTVFTGVRIGPGLLRDVPVTLRHTTDVLKTHGSEALVSDERTVGIPGYTVADVTYRFDVNRKTFQRAFYFKDAVPSRGVTFNWPLGTKPHDYPAWVADTQQTTTARFIATEKRGGIDTYVFRTHVPDTRITDPQLLSLLPASMTKQQLLEITPSLEFSTKRLLALNKLLKQLPDPVPLAYTYSTQSTYWVAPTSGIVVDVSKHEVRTLNFVKGTKLIPINAIMDMNYSAPAATLHAAVADANSTAHKLRLLRISLPVSLLLGGLVLLLVGGVLVLGRRKFRAPLGDEELADVLLSGEERVPTHFV